MTDKEKLISFLLTGTFGACAALILIGQISAAIKCAMYTALCAVILALASILISKLKL
jgi:hypothetical protein